MKSRISLKVVMACLALVGLAFADVDSDIRDLELKKEKLNTEIKRLDSQIAETDSLLKEDNAHKAMLESRYKKDSERRKAEADSLSVKIKRVAADLQIERENQAKFRERIDNVKAKRKAISAILANISERFEAQVEQTLPWDIDIRLDRVKSLTRDIKSGNATEEEAFSRLKSLIAEEIKFGDEVVVANTPITRNDGTLVNARILRIGNQWMVYADENGTLFGSMIRKIEKGKIVFVWNEDLDLGERAAIMNALDVKQAKKPPQIVTLPVSLSVVRED